ncbi:hypothetical protein JB92DRAFT_2869728 [Gautieria morchelliformis]|nr:hypothetical protein JB92DRAFT_2869728 [Gautieria morchelliformis]
MNFSCCVPASVSRFVEQTPLDPRSLRQERWNTIATRGTGLHIEHTRLEAEFDRSTTKFSPGGSK